MKSLIEMYGGQTKVSNAAAPVLADATSRKALMEKEFTAFTRWMAKAYLRFPQAVRISFLSDFGQYEERVNKSYEDADLEVFRLVLNQLRSHVEELLKQHPL